MSEIAEWVPVTGHNGRYEVSDKGEVRFSGGRLLKQYRRPDGYLTVRLSRPRTTVRVHRMVSMHFHKNPDNLPWVNHLDCDRANNAKENLEWCTPAQNVAYSVKLGRMKSDYWKGKRAATAKISDETVAIVRAEYARGGTSWKKLGEKFSINTMAVGRLLTGKTYAPIKGNAP